MSDTPNEHAVRAAMWADMAVSDVHRAARALAAVSMQVARDLHREETDFLLATQEIENAWKSLTMDALTNIGRAREALVSAREEAVKISNAMQSKGQAA